MARYFRSSLRSRCRVRQARIVSIARCMNARQENDLLSAKDRVSAKAATDSPSRYWDMVILSKKMSRAILPQLSFWRDPFSALGRFAAERRIFGIAQSHAAV